MTGAEQGPPLPPYREPQTLQELAALNRYDSVVKVLDLFLANGNLADYDDELANRVKDAKTIVRGVCRLANQPV